MLALGLNWWQAFLATLIGHVLASLLVVAASFPGLYYNISFPVATRVAWGKFFTVEANLAMPTYGVQQVTQALSLWL